MGGGGWAREEENKSHSAHLELETWAELKKNVFVYQKVEQAGGWWVNGKKYMSTLLDLGLSRAERRKTVSAFC